jgi:spermidine/putrescine transport system ATP-binding protein
MENPAATPAVELRNVTKCYGDVVAVDNVSLEIQLGEFFSLLGPSGCGKTTTLRMVAGFAHPTEGQVYIMGKLVNGVPAYERDTNLVFQQLALFPHMDVYDNIAFGPNVKRKLNKGEIRERVKRVLDLVELSGYENRLIQQLSGGQQQRVAIARALINEPTVLLLDEPLGALDLKLRLQMQVELKAIQQRVGTTFIYVTHDQGEAITMSDRIAVVNKGRIEQVAASEVIYSRPATKFVAQFIGDTNLLDGRVESKEGSVLIVESQGVKIRTRDGNGESLSPGNIIHMSLRPEKIKLLRQNQNRIQRDAPVVENVFEGRIKNETFMGSIIRYVVVLDGGPELLVEASNETDDILHVGDAAQVTWSKESCILLKGE